MTKNDWKYVLKRVITYIAIAMIMLLLGSCNVHALTFTQEVTRHSVFEFTTSKMTKQANANTTISYDYSFNNVINCDTDMCGLEFNYLATAKFENYNNNANTYQAEQNFIASSGLVVVSDSIYNVSINGNSIVVIVPKNSTLKDLSLYFATNQYPNANVVATLTLEVSPRVTIYNVSGNLAQAINDNTNAVNNVNNTLNDDTAPSTSDISSSSSDWSSNNTDSGVINNLVLMPITLLNSVVNGLSGTCSTYTIGELWGENLTLPCIDLSNILGSVWTIIDVIMSGVFIFIFGKRCVKIFNDFTNLRSGQIDSLYGGGE